MLWLLGCYYVSQLALNGAIWWSFLALVTIGLPHFIANSYQAAIARHIRLSQIEEGSRVYFLASGSLFSNLLAALSSAMFGFLTIFWFLATTQLEQIVIAASIPVYYLIQVSVKRQLSGTVKRLSLHSVSEVLARGLFTALMVAGYIALLVWSIGSASNVIMEAEVSRVAIDLTESRSVLVQLLHNFAGSYEYLRNMLIRQLLYDEGYWKLLVLAGLLSVWFYQLGVMFAAFSISFDQYTLAIPRQPRDENQASRFREGFIIGVTLIVVYGFVALPTLLSTETYLRSDPDTLKLLVDSDQFIFSQVERIDNQLYAVGTTQAVESAKHELDGQLLALVDSNQMDIQQKIRHAFQKMRSNVDVYLDYYYSLPAEYTRLASAVTGKMEEHITKDVQRYLNRDVEDIDFMMLVDSHSEKVSQLITAHDEKVKQILDGNRVSAATSSTFVVVKDLSIDLFSALASPSFESTISFSNRMGATGATSLAAMITAKIVGKLAVKPVISTAAKAAAKFGGNKLATSAGGAAAGALIGTLVPGAGTIVGGVIGAAVGLFTGVAVDVGLLTLEEEFSRHEFRKEIIHAIDSVEREILEGLLK